jgi:hypothetical protein
VTKKRKAAANPTEPRIVIVRGQRIILDADLAEVYGVEVRALNQAVKRNAERFPPDFAFQLTAEEAESVRSQIVISKTPAAGDDTEREANSSQFVISSRRGRTYRPWAFTEHGALMAANILRSKRAVQMSVYVVRAFVRQREHLMANAEVLKRLTEIDRTLLEHDQSLQFIWKQLEPLLNTPDPLRPQIGFHP